MLSIFLLSTTLSAMPVDTAAWAVFGGQAFGELGKSVSAAGDVNGDGYGDVLVGMHYYSGPEYREGKVFLYYGGPAGLSPTADWSWECNVANATLGISVSTAGDVNGDGFDDVLLGAHTYSGDVANEGAVFLFYGGPEGPASEPDWEAFGGQSGGDFGGSVSDAGDVNNDGYHDIVVGAVFYSNGQTGEGRAYVYYGSPDGMLDEPWIMEINQAGAQFGGHVSGAGDVNGDGFDDVVVGARKYAGGSIGEGAVYVYHGAATGLPATHNWMYESNSVQAKLGQSVSGAGDVNGDGFSDIIAGAHNFSSPETDEGKIYVFHGSASGLGAEPAFEFESNLVNALLGNQVSDAGDVNGDGYDDVIAGSREYSNGEASEGRAFLFFGSATGLSAASYTYTESNQAGAFYGYSVHGAGDVNGDLADDYVVGAKYWVESLEDEGAAFLFLGTPPVPVCHAPEGVLVSSITTSGALVSWISTAAATGYRVVVKKAGSPASLFVTASTSVSLSGLNPGTTYRVIVMAKCGGLFSERSDAMLFTTSE